jgi:hypothetical protein
MTDTDETRQCHKCGAELDDLSNFCTDCGEQIPLTECPECTTAVEPHWNFCRECGHDLIQAVIQKPTGCEDSAKIRVKVPVTPTTRADYDIDHRPHHTERASGAQTEAVIQAEARNAGLLGQGSTEELLRLISEAETLRFNESHYLIREKHMTWGAQAWVLNKSQNLLLFAKESGSYSREFFFYANEDAAKSGMVPLIHVEQTAKGLRGLQGADFVIRNWRGEDLFLVSRTLTSMNRTWKISTPDDRAWGRAFEGGGTSVARRLPFISGFTVLSMKVETENGRDVASFTRKRMSLGDVYALDIHEPEVDRRLLIALGVLFETIHD